MQATASARHHALAFMASFYGSRRVEVRSVFVTIVSRGVADSYMYSHRRNWMLRLKNSRAKLPPTREAPRVKGHLHTIQCSDGLIKPPCRFFCYRWKVTVGARRWTKSLERVAFRYELVLLAPWSTLRIQRYAFRWADVRQPDKRTNLAHNNATVHTLSSLYNVNKYVLQ
jgi:hypothetical protein